MKLIIFWEAIFCSILEIGNNLETGLYLFKRSRSPFLKTGIILAVLNKSEKISSWKDQLTKPHRRYWFYILRERP